MPLMFSTCQQTEYFLYVSVFSLPEPSLYRLRYYFWLFFWRPPPLSLALLHEGQESLALAWSSQPVLGSWDLGELPAVPQCAGSPLSLAPATFNSAFLLQARPRIQYRGALCWEQRHTPLGVYTHIHTFINHWKRQDQRRKEEQTPLRCWAWLRVALDTDGCTQDNCCLLFMEGPSATLRALFIWRLLKAPGQEPRGKSKLELCVSTVCVQVCAKRSHVCGCVHTFSWYVHLLYLGLFFCYFHVEYVLFVQRGVKEAMFFHCGVSHNKVITAGQGTLPLGPDKRCSSAILCNR